MAQARIRRVRLELDLALLVREEFAADALSSRSMYLKLFGFEPVGSANARVAALEAKLSRLERLYAEAECGKVTA